MTRRLNELHINEVIKAINQDTLIYIKIVKAKKPRGAHNISYRLQEKDTIATVNISKGKTGYNNKVRLVNALNEIKEHLSQGDLVDAYLCYNRESDKLDYKVVSKN